ncbi:MAG: acyl-CoA/acyl-ACP dehydrogenase [Ilumatobacter sp.]|nr:acyl-CoA/acyl-ACP dehydrogenase [Ilumatobacter sp.]
MTTERPAEIDERGGPHWTGAPAGSTWIELARDLTPRLAEDAERHDRDGTFVADGMALLREHRLLSMLVPSELGGGGATHAEACAVLSELAHGCPSTSLAFSMHSHLVAAQVWRHHHDLPAPVLQKVADQQLCLISTGASDWLESNGTASKVDGGYRVSARKLPSSGCPAGDVLVTTIRWDDAPEGPQVLHCSVPFAADGVTIEETWDTLGMRGTGSHTVVLDDVFVPDAAVAMTRPAGEWHPVYSVVLGAAMPLIMSTYVGVAESAVERAVGLARRNADRPDVQTLAGRMHNRLTAARDAVAAMIASSDDLRFDNTDDHADLVVRRKSNATEACIDAVRLALEVGGGPAFSRSSGIERLYRDVHGCLYHPLTAGRQELFTGSRVLA